VSAELEVKVENTVNQIDFRDGRISKRDLLNDKQDL
jgi:hypothetical protein